MNSSLTDLREENALPTFDLTTQAWIPVRDQNGSGTLVSLETVLLNARNYERIEDASPLVTAALHRFLLAVLHRALEGPETAREAADWFQNGFPDDKVLGYLERWRHRFDLFSQTEPFYQLAGLPLEGRTDHWSRLSAERGTGNTSFLFNEAKRDTKFTPSDTIAPHEAARRLLEHQTFALGGLIKRFITSAPGAPVATAAVVIVQGKNLLETLCLNLVPYPKALQGHDLPIWEQRPLTVPDVQSGPSRAFTGLTDRYAWFSRSIRFEPELEDDQTVVRFMAFDSGVKPLEAEHQFDPMVVRRQDKKDANRFFPMGLREDRGLWRDFHALVPKPTAADTKPPQVVENALEVLRYANQSRRNPVTLGVFGLSNDQAKIQLWRSESFRLPDAALTDFDVYGFVRSQLEAAEETGSYLRSAGRALAANLLSAGDRSPHKDDISKLAASFPHLSHYWSTLEREFAGLLERLPGDPDVFQAQQRALENGWLDILARTARQAFDLAAVSAGDDARALRAIESSRRVLETHLWKLRPRQEEATP
jgi:CRISPR system Cascade subunit CasA